MYKIDITYFRDRSAVIKCSDEPNIITRLLVQLPGEFIKVDSSTLFMFDYSRDRFMDIIKEFFNPDVITVEDHQFSNEAVNNFSQIRL